MLALSGSIITLSNLKVTARQRLAGQDMSGQSAATAQAETGDKAKVLAVTGFLPFANAKELSSLFTLAGAKDNGARTIYRIDNRTANALSIRQVKFQGNITAQEEMTLRQWTISFELVEHLSVPERVESREPDKQAAQQKVEGVATPVSGEPVEGVPPNTEVEMGLFMKAATHVEKILS